MATGPIISRSMFPLSSGINNIMGMKERYDVLQNQLASGQKASRLSEMGSDRYFDLALRQRITRIDSFQESIKSVDLRLNVLDQTVSRLDIIEADMRAVTLSGSGGQSSLNFDTAPATAAAAFDEVLTLLNVDVAGRYMFGGKETERPPIEDGLTILNGLGNRSGLLTLVDERRRADLGTDNRGRLTIPVPAANVATLAEGALADMPFGMKLSTVVTNSSNITVTAPAAWQDGDPVPATARELTVAFGATLPNPGETVTISLKMPDDSVETITLAATTDPSSATGFQIGADANATAANFATALGLAVEKMAKGTMVTASSYEASNNFFFGQGEVPQRVNGAPPETATTLVAGNTANTVFWYKGADSGSSIDARRSITARVGEGATVAYGVEANERGLVNLVRALGTMAIQTFPKTDATSTDRYNAMTARNNKMLAENAQTNTGSIEMIAVELGLAKSTTGTVAERHTAHKAQLNNMLQDIEEAPTEVVAMEILALKTRLEASYQTTAMLSQLALVNYLK
jgi:flagellar hook-associated protein 3 FlgL